MGVLVDASGPARFSGTPSRGLSYVSASFTAPANALLVCCVAQDGGSTDTGPHTVTVSDSGALTWTKQVERQVNETPVGGLSAVWTARTTTAAARTLTVARGTDGDNTNRRGSATAYVLTGVDVDGTPVDAVDASNEGGSATNNLTTSPVTPGADGLLVVSDCEWNELGVLTSSDLTIDSADYAGAISVASGYKACSSGVGVTADLNAGGTAAAQHKWCQIVVRAAVLAGDTLMGQACL